MPEPQLVSVPALMPPVSASASRLPSLGQQQLGQQQLERVFVQFFFGSSFFTEAAGAAAAAGAAVLVAATVFSSGFEGPQPMSDANFENIDWFSDEMLPPSLNQKRFDDRELINNLYPMELFFINNNSSARDDRCDA